MHSLYCVCSLLRLRCGSYLSPLALSSLFISGSIRNTARSKGKHKQTVPSLTAPSPRPSKRVYVGWIDSISPLHRLHRAAPHFTNKEKTRIGNVHFEPLHWPLICLFIYLEQRGITQYPPLYLEGLYNLFFYYIRGELKMTHSRISIHRQLVPTVCTLI